MAERLPELLDRDVYAIESDEATIYVLEADHGVKIGVSRFCDVGPRKRDLERAAGRTLHVVGTWKVDSAMRARFIEKAAHRLLADDRLIGEWFCTHPLTARALVDRMVRNGVPVEALRSAAS